MSERLWLDYSSARPDLTGYVGVMRYLKIYDWYTTSLTAAEVADLQARKIPIGIIAETDGRTEEGAALAIKHVGFANAAADKLGVPADVAIFYTVDFDTTKPEDYEPYVKALLETPGRPVGLYGECDVTRRAREMGVKWTWQTYAWSYGKVDTDANLYQRQNLGAYDINLERSWFPAWGYPAAPVVIEPPAPPITEEPPVATRKPPCTRVLWRGVVVCSHTVPKLNAWAASVGDGILLKPLAGCGSYQTTTAASAGTHAGGGAIDIDLRYVASNLRRWVMDKARLVGLQVGWARDAITGLWTWHGHAIDPDCPQLASAAAAQCVECFNGGDGLVGSNPDFQTRTNIAKLKTIFGNRLYQAVTSIGDAIGGIGGAVVLDTAVKSIQSALRQTVDGKMGDATYGAVWRLSVASVKGRDGFLAMSLDQRKALQHDIGAVQDGDWLATGSEMPKRVGDAVGGVQRALGTPIDRTWSTSVDGPAFGKVYTAAGYAPPSVRAANVVKVKAIQTALRILVDGVMDAETYWAVWRLSMASVKGRDGFNSMSFENRMALQRNLGCKYIDGVWATTNSEMPGKVRAGVGGVQRAMGTTIDYTWSTAVDGPAFGKIYTMAGFKP